MSTVRDAEVGSDIRLSRRGLVYSDRGSGPVVVLLHGWCLNRRLWDVQEEALAADHRVIAPDMAGFGESARLSGPYDLERHADDVSDLLAELEVGEVTVVGFAFGAAVAMVMSARSPAPLAKLVLIGVPSAATAPYERMPKAMRRDWPEFARLSAGAICKTDQSAATLAWLAAMFGATRLPVALETVGVLGRFEPAAVAPQVTTSSVFVHGELDDVVPPSISHDCAALIAGARVEIVAGSGHLVPVDGRARLAEILAEAP